MWLGRIYQSKPLRYPRLGHTPLDNPALECNSFRAYSVETQPYVRIQKSRLSKVVVWLRITVDEEKIAIVMGHLEPFKKICMKNTLLFRSVPFVFTITAILKTYVCTLL